MHRPNNQIAMPHSSYTIPSHSNSYQASQITTTSISQGLMNSLGMAPKINQIINSVYAMNHAEMQSQLFTCSKIVGQLLQNDLVSMATNNAVRLICFELVLMIAEEQSVGNYSMNKIENDFSKNKTIKLTASLKNVLSGINQLLEGIIWTQSNKGNPKKCFSQNQIFDSGIHQHYLEFKALMADYDKLLLEQSDEDQHSTSLMSSVKQYNRFSPELIKAHQQEERQKQQEYEALIEQLQEIVGKKEKRIKQMTEELEENILDQKNLQDLIEELQNRNYQISEELRNVHSRLGQYDQSDIVMKEKMAQINSQNLVLEKQLENLKKQNRTKTATEKKIKTKLSFEENLFDESGKKSKPRVRDLLFGDEDTLQVSKQKNKEIEEFETLSRMLMVQAASIEGLL